MNSDKIKFDYKIEQKWFKHTINDPSPFIQDEDPEYAKYKYEVDKLTEEIAYLVPGISLRKFREWDLDHKIPIKYGFLNGIHPLKIACLSNLQVIPHRDNFIKNTKIIFPLNILDQHDKIQAQLQDG